MEIRRLSAVLVVLGVLLPRYAWCHPGVVDPHGGHYDRRSGEYHCHPGEARSQHEPVRSFEEHAHGVAGHFYRHAHPMPTWPIPVPAQPVDCEGLERRRNQESERGMPEGAPTPSGPSAAKGKFDIVRVLMPDCSYAYVSRDLLGKVKVNLGTRAQPNYVVVEVRDDLTECGGSGSGKGAAPDRSPSED